MQRPLPTGTVTMLFSDMEGSTQLLTRLGKDYAQVLHEQRLLMRAAIDASHGCELGTEGDSFFVAFGSARDAMQACVQAQRSLADHGWPDDAIVRLRMGLHTGEPEPHEDGYVGMDVHLAARVAAAAHGGQVVISEATRRLVGGSLPDGTWVKHLGDHRLKDIAGLQQLHQLVVSGLQEDFPALRSLGTRTNLPTPAYALVGRERELDELSGMLASGQTRLLTLTGPGGAGKTRLAVAVAEAVGDRHADGVYFVALGDVTDVGVAWTSLAEVLGLTGERRTPSTLLDHVADRRMLVLLDNLEQLPDACASMVTQLLAASPGLSLLATSRRPVHVSGEQEYAVDPLAVPSTAGRRVTVAEAEQAGAVALFVQLARLVRPAFSLTPDSVDDVVEICSQLDGLPLALELAAARSKLLSPTALLARLGQSLGMSASHVRRPTRQQTLRATVAWSYDLLQPELQTVFRRIGVLSGGADLAAVSAVTGVDDPVDVLAELVDASLIRVHEGPQSSLRVSMLETIRRFAVEELERAGEDDDAFRAHANHYLALAERLAADDRGPNVLQVRDEIERELGNLRQVLTWTLGAPGDSRVAPAERGILGLRMCSALSWFWYTSGYVAEGREWAERASAVASAEEGEELAKVLHTLGILTMQQGQLDTGRDIITRSLRIWRRLGDPSGISRELNSLGVAARSLGEADTARRLFEESLRVGRTAGDQVRVATAQSNLGLLELDEGRVGPAIERFAEAEEADRQRGDRWGVAISRANRVGALVEGGRADEGIVLLRSLAADVAELGDTDLTIGVIELFSVCHAATGDALRAGRLSGAAEALREWAGLPIPEPDQVYLDRHLARARATMSADGWRAQREAGRALGLDEALAHARAAD